MIKDFRDANKDIVTMFRGTDTYHKFQYVHDDGSTFIYSQYDIVCEGRLSSMNEQTDFIFNISEGWFEGESYLIIAFTKDIISEYIRENKIYFKVKATHKISAETIVINYGELWLR